MQRRGMLDIHCFTCFAMQDDERPMLIRYDTQLHFLLPDEDTVMCGYILLHITRILNTPHSYIRCRNYFIIRNFNMITILAARFSCAASGRSAPGPTNGLCILLYQYSQHRIPTRCFGFHTKYRWSPAGTFKLRL